jgi:chaperonin GroES
LNTEKTRKKLVKTIAKLNGKTPKPPACPLRALDDRVIIQPDEANNMSKGGILLPDEVLSKEKPQKGTVVAVGPGKKATCDPPEDPMLWPVGGDARWFYIPTAVKVGDRVVFNRYAGVVVPGYDQFLMMREDDVLAVIEGE